MTANQQPAGGSHHEPGHHETPHHHAEELKHFSPGEVVFRAGDPGHTMFICVRGQLEVRIGDRVADVIHPGGFLGELGVIDPGPRAGSAVATAHTDLLEIDEAEFLKLIQTKPFFALKLLRVLTARIKRTHAMSELAV